MKAGGERIKPVDDSSLAEAVALWLEGHLVAFGTETVYGLGADATNAEAVALIFEAKQRPAFNPLISHVSCIEAAFALGMETPLAKRLAAAFWPGPMSLVLRRREDCPVADIATAGLDSIALRVPESEAARRLLAAFGRPVAAPSANPSGGLSPTSAAHVAASFHGTEPVLVLDSGSCGRGLESTVIDARGQVPVILRPGSITAEMITEATGIEPDTPKGGILSPGQLLSHYAPDTPLRLNAATAEPDEAWLGFGTEPDLPASCVRLNLSPSGRLDEAAANFFSMLRQLDEAEPRRIAIAPIPDQGLGFAINDRLRRASASKPQKTPSRQ